VAPNYLELLARLHDSGVELVIVGGVAAALHGGTRVTFDLDVVPRLEPRGWGAAIDLLWSLGARPRIPEPLERIRDIEQVKRWRLEKGMLALNFRSADGTTEVDLLVSESEHFDELSERALPLTVQGRTYLVASIDDLLTMKERAGRPQDLLDIAELKEIQRRAGTVS
jgi:hypothetical protein